jgi:phage N-6-adenine-methyltransferase
VRRCSRSGCLNPLPAPSAGRPRRYCSDACRKAEYRRRARRAAPFYATTGNDEWATPSALVDELAGELGPFDLDPAATLLNAKAPAFYTLSMDGLAQPWRGRVFCNPPYSEVARWVARGWLASVAEGAIVVLLVPARTDASWWHQWATRGEIRYLKGRLRFGDGKQAAPFPSALVVFRPVFRPTADEYETRDESLEAEPS